MDRKERQPGCGKGGTVPLCHGDAVDSVSAYGKNFALLTQGEDHKGAFMKKLAIAFAAAAALVIIAAPLSQANANNKKLWQGWVEEVQKAVSGAKAPAKK